MKSLNLNDLLKPRTRKPISVPVPEIEAGSVVYVLNPTPDQSDLAQMQWQSFRKEGSAVGFTKFLVTWALADQDNEPLVDAGDSEEEVSDSFVSTMNDLAGKDGLPSTAVKRIFDAAMKSFGLSKTDLAELEKNSSPTTSEDGSGSKPKPSDSAESNG